MIKSILLILSLLISNLFYSGNLINRPRKKTNSFSISDYVSITENNYYTNFDNINVYGNYSDIDNVQKLLEDKTKIYIFYDFNLDDNLNYNLEIMNNNCCIYYYKNNIKHADMLSSSTTDTQKLKTEIIEFIDEKLTNISEQDSINYSTRSTTNLFSTTLYSSSFRKLHKPYGYVDCDYNVKKYRANDVSSLYLIESHIYFTPGKVAKENGSSDYENYYNSKGYIHLKAQPAEKVVGDDQIRYGGTPVFKDAYPVNSPSKITISSSFSSGTNLGYSFSNGYSLDNVSIEAGVEFGANIGYSYSKSITSDDPVISAQKNAEDAQMFEWNYTYDSVKEETFHLFTGYMFEMNNEGHDIEEGDLAFRYNYQLVVKKRFLGIPHSEQICTGTSYHNYYTAG